MKICYGVFDWGLGHATRSIPVINQLAKKDEVHILSTGNALELLKKRFRENCWFHDVKSIYSVYGPTKSFRMHFAMSIPRMLFTLRKAREASEKIIRKEKFDAVISDCRYDVYDKIENSYLLNHQGRFNAPVGFENVLEIWLGKRIRKYKYMLVPDYAENSLSGKLSHNLRLVNSKIRYIGILSQINKLEVKRDIDYFFSLSGPVQTKKELEKKILESVKGFEGEIVIAGGEPMLKRRKKYKNVKYYDFLDSRKQEEMMNRAKLVIVRSGYTTIMELAELEKNALLIPSPGQTEQEYLVKHLKESGHYYSVSQDRLKLKQDLDRTREYHGYSPAWKSEESVRKILKIINN